MTPSALPPRAFGLQQLVIVPIEGTTLHRFFRSRFRDPRAWSLAIHEHPSGVDGILWASRLHGGACCAVYDRALPKLRVLEVRPLAGFPRELAAVIAGQRIALIP